MSKAAKNVKEHFTAPYKVPVTPYSGSAIPKESAGMVLNFITAHSSMPWRIIHITMILGSLHKQEWSRKKDSTRKQSTQRPPKQTSQLGGCPGKSMLLHSSNQTPWHTSCIHDILDFSIKRCQAAKTRG